MVFLDLVAEDRQICRADVSRSSSAHESGVPERRCADGRRAGHQAEWVCGARRRHGGNVWQPLHRIDRAARNIRLETSGQDVRRNDMPSQSLEHGPESAKPRLCNVRRWLKRAERRSPPRLAPGSDSSTACTSDEG